MEHFGTEKAVTGDINTDTDKLSFDYRNQFSTMSDLMTAIPYSTALLTQACYQHCVIYRCRQMHMRKDFLVSERQKLL